ncbi:MAG: PAS domain S-box protein, partial [Candidatus Hydrogenedentes bacterium]|nr:PAS domain S-box protein [Candidatus Hydrogenedentota bacterium]
WVLTDRAGNDADRDNLRNFLSRAESVGAMLDPEWVAGLEGSPEDEIGPAYVKKTQLLSSVCDRQADVRFAYVMAPRHGRIVFLMDAQSQRMFDPASESHSGDEYTEATPELKALFGGGEGFVEGPVSDHWGTWVSALVPLRTSATAKTIAVFGMDVSADMWNRDVIRHRMNGIGFTMLVLLLTLSYVMALQYSRDTSLRTAASERMHRTLVEGSPNGVLLLDEDGRIARINNTMTATMGWRDANLTGRFFADLWPESVRADVDAALAQAQAGRPAYFDAECERDDNGTLVAWEVVLNPVVDRDAHVRRVVCIANDVTARHEAEVALRASEEKYHTLFASSADGVLLMGDTILDCNEQTCRMWGCSREDVIGYTPLDFSPPVQPGGLYSADVAREHVDAAMKGTPQVFYWRHRRKDGSPLDAEISLKAVSVGGQQVLLASVRDITKRRKAEERLAKINACFLGLGSDAHENIDRLTALCGELMDASCAMYNHMEEGRLCSLSQWNAPSDFHFDSARDGHICNDVIRGNDDGVVVLRDLPQSPYAEIEASILRYGLRTYVGKAVKCGGKATGSLCVLYRRDFEPGEMEFSTVGIVASAIGIEEERLHALRTLAESEERYRTFADNVPLHLAVTDLNGKFTLWNRYSEIMFGYTAQEAIGQLNIRDLFPVREEAQRVMEGAVARGMYDRETTMKRQSGAMVPVHLVVVPCKQTGGAITAFFAFAEDIAERKHAEERLRHARDDAEAMNEQLESAIERANRLAFDAELANIAKSQFLANMSHEIRTPMNAIIGMTGLLLDTTLDAEQREFLDIVRGAAESLLALINDILDFSKVEAGKLDLETLDFDLRSTVEDTMDMLAVKAHDKGLEFACLIHHDVPALLRGDPGRLRQILINLCNNAVKFTHAGEVLVRVTLAAETDAHVTLHFAVTDTGIGIPQDRLDKLFQSFSQIDASTTRKYGGTGLGLAISKKLSELMGGKIGVESKEGEGSTFWFTVVLDKQSSTSAGARTPERENLDLAGQRILIVDDNATNRLVFREQLRSYGCVSDEAASGAEALAKLEEAAARHVPYAAALIDLLMPEMDGAELARAIKDNAALKDTVLIMITSRGQRGDAKATKALGFAGYLTKPVRTA